MQLSQWVSSPAHGTNFIIINNNYTPHLLSPAQLIGGIYKMHEVPFSDDTSIMARYLNYYDNYL